MFDTILLSFDTEFTHPVPRLGAMMQIGCVAVLLDTKTNTLGEKEETFKATFKVEGGHVVKDWVRKNQAALLSECMLTSQENHERRVNAFREWLDTLPEKFGVADDTEVLPYGWCIGSDIAYLLDILGPYNEMVSYRALDLKALMSGRWGKIHVTEKEATMRLGVVDNGHQRHDALADAKYQLELFAALLEDPTFRVS